MESEFSLQCSLVCHWSLHPITIPHLTFRNKLVFYGKELLASRPTHMLEDHPLSGVTTAYSIYSQLRSLSGR